MTPEHPFDAGLQPERTLLAWRRTCLALAVASAVVVRFTAPELGGVAVLAGVLGLALCLGAWAAATHRYRRAHTALHAAGSLNSGAVPIAALSAAAVLLSAMGLAVSVVAWWPW